jgi:aminopeptidase N
VLWKSYRDQWLMEALANYSALLILEQRNPAQFHAILEKYRSDLAARDKDGQLLREAGPVTLGQRLISSHVPAGYEVITYERGTWLMHMLRSMLRDAEQSAPARRREANPEEPFFRALRKASERYAGKSISTTDFIQIFEEELPRPLWYESRHKLDWFVDSWINGTALPEISARDVHVSADGGVTTVSGVIVQKDAPDNLITAVPIYAESSASSLLFLGQVMADGKETTFRLTTPAKVDKVVIDPRQTILTAPK